MSQNQKPTHLSPSHMAAYADLFERMLDPTFLLDPTSALILEANPAAERILAGGGEEQIGESRLIGRSIMQFVEVQGRTDFERALRVAMRRHHPRVFEMNLHAAQGLIVSEILACPLKLSDGKELLQVILKDITFRRQAEKKMQLLVRDLEEANQKLEKLSTQDAMTGLYNFRCFSDEHGHEHMRASRYGTSYSLIFMDVDHFKNYNDRNGHPAGDELLRRLAALVKNLARTVDHCARYGGEEFVVLCPHVAAADALNLAERIRALVESTPFPHAEGQPSGKVTVSVGVAGFPGDGTSAEAIIEAADSAMYYSKKNGRNRVTLHSSLAAVPMKKAI